MANRYWVGGTGTWDNSSTTHWASTSGGTAGASAPTTADAVIFDANSNTGTNDFTVTLGTSPACLTLNTTGIDPATAMTVDGTGSLTVAGSTFTLTNKVVWTNTGTITFTSGVPTINITTAGVSIASNTVFTTSGSGTQNFNFVDNFTSTGSMTLTKGGLTTTSSNKTVSVASFLTSSANTKTLNLGAGSTLNLTGNGITILDFATGSSGLTITSPTAVNCTYSGSTGTRTVNLGSTAWAGNTLIVSAGSDTFTLTANDFVDTLNFTGFSGTWTNVAATLRTLSLSSTMTVGSGTNALTFSGGSGGITSNGVTVDCPITVNNSTFITTVAGDLTLGSTRTFSLTAGTVALGASTLSTGIFSTTGNSTRSVTHTSGQITVTGNGTTVCTITGPSITMSAFTITSNYSGSTGTRTFNIATIYPNVSITAGSDTVTFTAANVVTELNFTGFTGTWSNVAMTVGSNLTVSSGMTVDSGSGTLTLASGTLTTNGKTFDFPVTINGIGGTVTLGDSLTVGSSRTTTLTAGTLALGANTLSTGIFTSSSANTRALTRTSGNVTITGNAATVLTLTGSGATYASSFTFTCNYAGSTGTRTFDILNSTVAISVSAGSDTVTFTASNNVGALNFTGFTGTWSNVALAINNDLTVASGMTVGAGTGVVTFTGNSTVTSNGKTFDFPVTVNGSGITVSLLGSLTVGSTRTTTLTQGTIALGASTLSTGIFTSSGTSTRAVTRTSGNITVTGNATTVLTLTGSGVTYGSGTAVTCSYAGSTGTRTFNVTKSTPSILISAGTDTVTFTANNVTGTLDFTGFSGTWNQVSASINFGDLTLSTGMTVGTKATLSFGGNSSSTITSNGKTLGNITLSGNSPPSAGLIVSLADALSCSGFLSFESVTFNTNNKSVTCANVVGPGFYPTTLNIGSSVWTVTDSGTVWSFSGSAPYITVTGTGTIKMTSASAKTFAGGGVTTWPTLENAGAGALTISGSNTFTTIKNSVAPTTFTFTAGTTQTVTNFNVNGSSGNFVTINSTTPGVQATLSKSSGVVQISQCNIQDSNVTGGAAWFAAGSINSGNNTGWIFSGGEFMMFFM